LTADDSSLREAWRAGRERWPEVGLGFETFASHVAGLRAEGDAPNDQDLAIHGGDLFLVAACLTNDGRALAALERDFLAPLPRIVTAIDPSPGFGMEVAQSLRERLLCPPKFRLRQYTGAGSLVGWLRVAAKRLAVDLKRRDGASLRQMGELETALARSQRDPEWELIHRRFRQPLETAMRGALDALGARDRMVLRLYLIRGENIGAIGRMYGVHRATVARWIVAAQRAIVDAVTTRLQNELGFSARECQSLARDLKSGLSFTLERLL
jgi:RNA polymerase sigma-70 factor (ECF subfamily)